LRGGRVGKYLFIGLVVLLGLALAVFALEFKEAVHLLRGEDFADLGAYFGMQANSFGLGLGQLLGAAFDHRLIKRLFYHGLFERAPGFAQAPPNGHYSIIIVAPYLAYLSQLLLRDPYTPQQVHWYRPIADHGLSWPELLIAP
jgi:hypothetical protein